MGTDISVRFDKYIKDNSLATPGDKILLAVSGGVDSMVMLELFARSGYDVGIAHCNFQLRGEESYEDEVLVEKSAERYGLTFFNRRFDTAGEMERTGESVQIAARRLRYDWFEELCRLHGYTAIAIAHHADDSIETFFINMFRGTGLKGLTGISVVNGKIIRPLMFATRKEILDYAHLKDIPFREDSSNRSTKYLRNKIRLGLVPMMKEISSHFTSIMTLNIRRLTDAQLYINHSIELLRREVQRESEGMIMIDPSKIDASFPKHFVVYELLSKYGFKGDVVYSLCNALGSEAGSGKRFYSKEFVAYIDRGRIIVAPVTDEDICAVTVEKDTSRVYSSNSVLYFEFIPVDNITSLRQPENIALLDADMIEFPLTVRRWMKGDWFVPFGMEGRKKISDQLIDDKVPLAEKKRQLVVESGGNIVWLCGRRIDDRYRITDRTETVLKITREIVS